jgi:hypothetical protein
MTVVKIKENGGGHEIRATKEPTCGPYAPLGSTIWEDVCVVLFWIFVVSHTNKTLG